MVWPQEGDIEFLKKDNIGVVLCPQSNLKLASGIPPIGLYLNNGIRVSLGTDSAASNNNLDIWEEMRLAALLAKGVTLDPTSLSAKAALRTVTIDAASTWGLEAELGSIEAGKKADLVVVDLSRPHNTPSYDVYSTLVYAAGAPDVRDVYVAGRRVLKDGKVTTLDEAQILKEARRWSEKIKDSRANA
jgi:5-methylthioadenosine/S-adenosylhomocysteine deaminase